MKIIDIPERQIPKQEFFDNSTQEFITIEARTIPAIHLQLEHSLISVSKWESKWKKPFSRDENMTPEELLDYIRCMTTNKGVKPEAYEDLTQEALVEIVEYMNDRQSAWEIRPQKEKKKKKKPDPVEMIYYAMVQYGIPIEVCEKWHYNRLLAFLDFCDAKGGSTPGGGSPKKRSEREIMEMYRAMNEKNRKKYNSKG